MSIHVCKFGGTSVGSMSAIDAVADIVAQIAERDRVAVVVSAVTGVTDLLVQSSQAAARGDFGRCVQIASQLRDLHVRLATQLVAGVARRLEYFTFLDGRLSDFDDMCRAIGHWQDESPRAADGLLSLGEQMSAPLVAAVLGDRGLRSEAVDASTLVVTDARFGNALPDLDATADRALDRLLPLLESGVVPVITGFIGATEAGELTTLGRGGSDYTAAIVAVSLGAATATFYKEVDGVMSADPRVVPGAFHLDRLSYEELAELSCFGANIIQYKAVRLLAEHRIPIAFKNTFNPEHRGTVIRAAGQTGASCVKAVTAVDKMSSITLNNPVEVRGGSRSLPVGWLGQAGEPVLTISHESPEDRSCQYIVPSNRVTDVRQCLFGSLELCPGRNASTACLSIDHDLAVVSVVGDRLRSCGRTVGRVLGALGRNDIAVRSAVFGGADSALRFVVDAVDARNAVRAIHELIV